MQLLAAPSSAAGPAGAAAQGCSSGSCAAGVLNGGAVLLEATQLGGIAPAPPLCSLCPDSPAEAASLMASGTFTALSCFSISTDVDSKLTRVSVLSEPLACASASFGISNAMLEIAASMHAHTSSRRIIPQDAALVRRICQYYHLRGALSEAASFQHAHRGEIHGGHVSVRGCDEMHVGSIWPAWEAVIQESPDDIVRDGVPKQQQLLLDGLHRHAQRRHTRLRLQQSHVSRQHLVGQAFKSRVDEALTG